MTIRLITSVILIWLLVPAIAYPETWDCEILPSEHKIEIDPESGAKIIFATTNPARDWNLYFHNRCFLWENQMLLFYSDRFGRSEIMGYLPETGELVRLNRAQAPPSGSPLASIKGDRLFVTRENSIYQWKLKIATVPRTSVQITEEKLTDFPEGTRQRSGLAENSDATLLAFACRNDTDFYIGVYDFATRQRRIITNVGFKLDHLQFHRHRPDILSFCRDYDSDVAPLDPAEPPRARIWFLNVNTAIPIPAFYQVPGELATHECWWVNDQLTFLGGHHRSESREEGHVKVLDLKTGDIRIIGAGAWWEEGTGYQIAQVNWWHASGSPDGKWVAADNWHGIVALFNAKTTEKKILTTGHRIYGGGIHLHVGWDLLGKMVEFTSLKLGNPNVCIGIIPENW
ncbi:hypothetical protein JXJ21_00180 [candidate division KSB1 bacterium]|nr:hypothetical protein [candidate division KSB1 bacterium]